MFQLLVVFLCLTAGLRDFGFARLIHCNMSICLSLSRHPHIPSPTGFTSLVEFILPLDYKDHDIRDGFFIHLGISSAYHKCSVNVDEFSLAIYRELYSILCNYLYVNGI